MITETLDKLFLEWAQFTGARTYKEQIMLATLDKISTCGSLDDAKALAMNAIRLREPNEMSRLRLELQQAHIALDQALSCIRGETPEDMTDEEARQDTIDKIRDVLNQN